MATHSSIHAWRSPRTEEPGGDTVHKVTKSWTQLKQLNTHKRRGCRFDPLLESQDPPCLVTKKPKHKTGAILQQIKALKMVHINKSFKKVKKRSTVFLEGDRPHMCPALKGNHSL